MDLFKIIAWSTTLLFLGLSLAGARWGSTYAFSFLFLGALLWLVYGIRQRAFLHPLHFALFATALVLHDLGTFGFYRKTFFNLQFDVYVHFYFGLVGGLMLCRAFRYNYHLSGWRLWLAVTVFLLGLGAVHELIEWASTLVLGPARGMLKLKANDPFDTQEDLFNNLLGSAVAFALYSLLSKRNPPQPSLKQAG